MLQYENDTQDDTNSAPERLTNDIILCDGYKQSRVVDEDGDYCVMCHCKDPAALLVPPQFSNQSSDQSSNSTAPFTKVRHADRGEGSYHQLCCYPPVFTIPKSTEDWRCSSCEAEIVCRKAKKDELLKTKVVEVRKQKKADEVNLEATKRQKEAEAAERYEKWMAEKVKNIQKC